MQKHWNTKTDIVGLLGNEIYSKEDTFKRTGSSVVLPIPISFVKVYTYLLKRTLVANFTPEELGCLT
jgi:hypothetical protein